MMEGRGMDQSGSRFCKVVGSCGHSNEPLGCIKCRKFFKQNGGERCEGKPLAQQAEQRERKIRADLSRVQTAFSILCSPSERNTHEEGVTSFGCTAPNHAALAGHTQHSHGICRQPQPYQHRAVSCHSCTLQFSAAHLRPAFLRLPSTGLN